MKCFRHSGFQILLTGVLLIIFSGCNLFDSGNGEDPENLRRPWELTALSDTEGSDIPLIEGDLHTARFSSDGTMGGETACNFYGGDFEAGKDGDIRLSNLVSTDIACEEPNHSEVFLNGLAESESYSVEKGNLVLFYGQAGRLEFQERLE